MVQCINDSCPEFGVEKDTTEATEFWGYEGYEVTCGGCGQPCQWPDGTPDPPEPEPEQEA